MAVAPAAGAAGAEVAVGLLDGVSLGLLVTWLILAGLAWTYRHSLGALLTVLASGLRAIHINLKFAHPRPFRGLANKIDDLNHAIHNGLGQAAARAENAAIYTFHAAGALQAWTAAEVAALSGDFLQGMHDILTRDIPAAKNDVLDRVKKQTHGIDRVNKSFQRQIEAELVRRIHGLDKLSQRRLDVLRRGIDRTIAQTKTAINKTLARDRAAVAQVRGITVRQARRIAALERAIAAAGGAALAGLRARVGRLERDVAKIKAGTGTKVGAGAAIVSIAAVWAALGKMGLGSLRCRNVKRSLNATCGLPLEVLEDLLAVGGLVGGTIGLVEFAREMRTVTEDIDGVVRHFWEVGDIL